MTQSNKIPCKPLGAKASFKEILERAGYITPKSHMRAAQFPSPPLYSAQEIAAARKVLDRLIVTKTVPSEVSSVSRSITVVESL